MNLPKKITDKIGTEVKASGHLFSHNKSLEEEVYKVLDVRPSAAIIADINKPKEPGRKAFELLLKNDSMKKAKWTKPFPID